MARRKAASSLPPVTLPAHLSPESAPAGTIVAVLSPSGEGTDGREYEVRCWVLYGRDAYARVVPTRPTLAEGDGRLYEVAGWRVVSPASVASGTKTAGRKGSAA